MLLICASAMDILTERIPNILIIMGILYMSIYRIAIINNPHYISMLIGFLMPILLLAPLFLFKAMGAGDIKLLAVAGMLFGHKEGFYCICYSILAAAVIALLKAIIYRNLLERIAVLIKYIKEQAIYAKSGFVMGDYMQKTNINKGAKLHFSIAILLGVMLTAWRQII